VWHYSLEKKRGFTAQSSLMDIQGNFELRLAARISSGDAGAGKNPGGDGNHFAETRFPLPPTPGPQGRTEGAVVLQASGGKS